LAVTVSASPRSRAWCVASSTSAADSTSPHVRLDEQSVELSADYRRKARDPSIELGDEHLPVGDLRRRKVDRVGVRLELRAIVLVRQ
jgi:hypothetical protein